MLITWLVVRDLLEKCMTHEHGRQLGSQNESLLDLTIVLEKVLRFGFRGVLYDEYVRRLINGVQRLVPC